MCHVSTMRRMVKIEASSHNCLVKPIVATISQTLIIGQDVTEFMGELICELAPVSALAPKEGL